MLLSAVVPPELCHFARLLTIGPLFCLLFFVFFQISIFLHLNYILIIWLSFNIIITAAILSINGYIFLVNHLLRLLSNTIGCFFDLALIELEVDADPFHGCIGFLILDIEVVQYLLQISSLVLRKHIFKSSMLGEHAVVGSFELLVILKELW